MEVDRGQCGPARPPTPGPWWPTSGSPCWVPEVKIPVADRPILIAAERNGVIPTGHAASCEALEALSWTTNTARLRGRSEALWPLSGVSWPDPWWPGGGRSTLSCSPGAELPLRDEVGYVVGQLCGVRRPVAGPAYRSLLKRFDRCVPSLLGGFEATLGGAFLDSVGALGGGVGALLGVRGALLSARPDRQRDRSLQHDLYPARARPPRRQAACGSTTPTSSASGRSGATTSRTGRHGIALLEALRDRGSYRELNTRPPVAA